MSQSGSRKILAVASAGGHWQQLMQLRDAFADQDTVFVSTHADNAQDVPHNKLRVVTDSNRHRPALLAKTTAEVLWCVLRERPDVVISTGAAPGLLAIVFGRVIGAKTVWVDSIANAEEVSLSGRLAVRVAGRSLTQWAHLAKPGGPEYQGSIL